jgi:hypothetical protein
MGVIHVKSNTVADFTGTVTVGNSAGATTTIAATDLVRPSDWNSNHSLLYTLTGNTLGNSTVGGTNLILAASGGVSLSGNGASLIISGPAPTPNRSFIEIMQGERMTTNWNFSETAMSNRIQFLPFWLDGVGLVPNTLRFMVTGIASSNRSLVGTFKAALYSAANSTQLSLLTSDSLALSWTDSSQSSVWNGFRALDFTGLSGATLTNEGRWVVALLVSMSGNNTTVANMGIYGGDNIPVLSGYFSGNTTSATNATRHIVPFFGGYSATTNGMPSTVGLTQINGNNSASMRDLYVVIKQI